MASGATMTWEDIHALDRVGPSYRPVQKMSAEMKARILLLVDRKFKYYEHAMLIHEEGGRTYLRGRCADLGLGTYCDPTTTERECEELRGRTVVQAVFSNYRAAYVLTDDGLLFSCGDPGVAQLGRRDTTVPYEKFGRVVIDGPVLAVAAGFNHVLAMTATKVFAFGLNNYCQVGVTGMWEVPEPREIYSGEGLQAPKQVACGDWHSVILTVGGQVLTCGRGEYTGHGHDNDVPRMTPVPKLQHVAVQQVGCTGDATYALADGVLYGWGGNYRGCLCVASQDDTILVPMVVDCGGRRISSIRCSRFMVLALTDTGEALHWGQCSDRTVISTPRRVEGCHYPREVFARGYYPDSGGTVYLDTPENNIRVFAAANDARDAAETKLQGATAQITELETELQRATAKITELERAVGEATRREAAANDVRTSAEAKLREANSKITELQNAVDKTSKREMAANDVRTSAEAKLREANSKITELQNAVDKTSKREMAVHNGLAANEARLRGKDNENRELRHAIEEATGREAVAWESSNAARESLRSLDAEHQVLQSSVVRLQMELESAREQVTLRENAVNEGQYTREVAVRELMEEFQNAVRIANQGTHGASATAIDGTGVSQEDREAMATRIASLEREVSDLRRDNNELRINYREIAMDFRDLDHDHQHLLLDSQREAYRGYRGGSTPLLSARRWGLERSTTDTPRDQLPPPDPPHRGRGSQRQSRLRPGRLHQQPPTDDGGDGRL